MSQLDLSEFIQKHTLGSEFTAQAIEYFVPLAQELANLHQNKQQSIIVGINGAQGSGKSTLSELLVEILERKYKLNAVTLSLDDFYYRRDERKQLANSIHPLLETRGVPGTHDVSLANETLNALVHHNGSESTFIPRFNKAIDDRYEQSQWSEVTQAPDIIIFEGWCVGAIAQQAEELKAPVNSLETNEDKDAIWRSYVNLQLTEQYQTLFDRFDCTVMLQAPSFQCVFKWRLEQEEKLIASLGNANKARTMSPEAIERFIQHYQRITEHVLNTLPHTAEYVFKLNSNRKIEARVKANGFNPLNVNALIFTDLDGSLLDHHTYSHDAAISTLEFCQQNSIAVMPCSSKTQHEIEQLRRVLNNHHPFIIENGAAVFIPIGYFSEQPADTEVVGKYWVKHFVNPHAHWMKILNSIRSEFEGLFQSFSSMTLDDIANATGLSLEQSQLAAQRQFGEPILWQGDEVEKSRFINAITDKGATVLQGGRFIHICGDANKGKALIWLSNTFQQMHSTPYSSIAIGDSHNDIQMLDMADYALIIRSPVHDIPVLSRVDHIYISDDFGPIGWGQGVHHILDDLFDHETSPVTGELHG